MASAIPKDDREALITLTQVKDDGSSLGRSARRIILGPTRAQLILGRATSSSKDNNERRPDENTGWFENPVVSRYHGCIEWDESSQSLFYHDTNSSHGSRINNKPVECLVKQRLKAGDKVTLGQFINSELKGFPPLHLQVGLQVGPPRLVKFGRTSQTRPVPTFTVPDDSDSDTSSAGPSPKPSSEPYVHTISDDENEEMIEHCMSDEDDGIEVSAQMLCQPLPSVYQSLSFQQGQKGVGHFAPLVPLSVGMPEKNNDLDSAPRLYCGHMDILGATSDHLQQSRDHFLEEVHQMDFNAGDSSFAGATELMHHALPKDAQKKSSPSILEASVDDSASSTSPDQGARAIPPTVDTIVFDDISQMMRAQDDVVERRTGSLGYILQSPKISPVTSPLETPGTLAHSMSKCETRLAENSDTPLKKRKFEEMVSDDVVEPNTTREAIETAEENIPEDSSDSSPENPSEPVDDLSSRSASEAPRCQTKEQTSTAEKDKASQAAAQTDNLDAQADSTITVTSTESGPARKRMRRVAEAMGYATLGGVAVMTALIATAPAL